MRTVSGGDRSGSPPPAVRPPAGSRAKPSVARPDDIRRHNLALMLREVHRDGALSRAELTQRLALSRSTIRLLVTDLCDLGLLQESVPVGGERAGRPSHVVAPRPDGPYALAVDVEVDRLSLAAVTVGGAVRWRHVRRLGADERSTRAVTRVITDVVAQAARDLDSAARPIGLGVSLPGTVRTHSGFVEDAPNLDWHSEPLGPMLRDLLPGLPVALGNDADMGALAEHLRGAGRGASDMIYLTGKVGVGAGILVNGLPLRGAGGLAGEIGHTMIDQDGPPCHCGGHGCVEGVIGEEALVRLAGRLGPPDAEAIAAVLNDARSGDAAARTALTQVARGLGQVLANLVNLLNPQVVVLGGALAGIFSCARTDVLAHLRGQAMAAPCAMVDVRTSALGADSSLLGAAELIFEDLLADPVSLAAVPAT